MELNSEFVSDTKGAQRALNSGNPKQVVSLQVVFDKRSPHVRHPLAKRSSSARQTFVSLVARAIRNAIRANRFARIIRKWKPYFYSSSGRLVNPLSFRFARITRFARIVRIDSRESRH